MNEELHVRCPLCDARKNVACERYDSQPGSHPERVAELLLHCARRGNGPSGQDLWNAVQAAAGRIPEGRRRVWERLYLPEVRKLCGFGR